MSFRYGIEYEFPLQWGNGEFVDFTTRHPGLLQAIVDELPIFESDYPGLRIGDLRLKLKRWYVEGFERFDEHGRFLYSEPKGIEIRTPICESIDAAVRTLKADFETFKAAARRHDLHPVAIGFNPYRTHYHPQPALNHWEQENRSSPEERTAHMVMLTYGPDVSISSSQMSARDVVEVGRKLTHYSPFIVPFCFNSPFFGNDCWGGLSKRVHFRMPARPSVLVFLDEKDSDLHQVSHPSLTQLARIPAEVGRIEFKGLDCVGDLDLYGSLLVLIKGLILDSTLVGRRPTPDGDLHRLAATAAFDSPEITRGANMVLDAAAAALPEAADRARLEPLMRMLDRRETPAHALLTRYGNTGDIAAALRADTELHPVALFADGLMADTLRK
jgi:Glutamate-cysteine ligase family 2(GCS2)